MSDWWYPGQLARQDRYGNPLPDEEWPAVQAAPEERAPLQITVRPPSAVKKELPPEFSPPDLPTQEHQSSFRRAMPKVYDPLQKQQQEVADFAYSFTPPGAISDIADAYQNKDPLGLILGVGGGIPGAGAGLKLAGKGVQAAARHPAATMGGLAAIGTMLSTEPAEAGKLSAAKTVMGELASPFYSAAGRAVDNAKLGKGTGEQWLGYLRNQPGVKPEELQYVFGNLPEGQLTKAQMQAHAAANEVKLGEVTRGNPISPKLRQLDEEIRPLSNWPADPLTARNPADQSRLDALLHEWDKENVLSKKPTKYAQWQLPGGENYRETLLTLPSATTDAAKAAENAYKLLERKKADLMAEWKGTAEANPPGHPDTLAAYQRVAAAQKEANAAHEEAARLYNQHKASQFKSSHWDEPNVLAHVRTNDREIPGVGKSLHVEEIQSDWHQKGRSGGYVNPEASKTYNAYLDDLKQRVKNDMRSEFERGGMSPEAAQKQINVVSWEMEPWQYAKYAGEDAKLKQLWDAKVAGESGVPDAPFKSTWADVALKRQIREASEKGYDAISWTPGEAQAARYDLSKHVSDVELHGTGDNLRLSAFDNNGRVIIDMQHTTRQELADHIGKEPAEKLLAQAEPDLQKNPYAARRLANADLKVGGEGMRAFYDKMLVDKANAIGKKHGARVEQSSLPKQRTMDEIATELGYGGWHSGLTAEQKATVNHVFDNEKVSGGPPVHVLRITPELRAAAMKGFTLFSAGGAVTLGSLAATDEAEAGGVGNILKAGRDPLWSPLSLQKLSEPLDMAAHRFKDVRVPVPKIVPAEKIVGGYGVFPPWDLAATNKTATHINNTKLEREVVAQGGMGFPEANPGLGLASTQGAAQGFERQMGELAQTGRPVYIMPQTMTPQTLDASHHVAEPLGQLVKQAPITRASVVEFNDMMRDQLAAQHARAVESAREAGRAIPDKPPPWVSIKNDKFDEYLNSLDMGSKSNIAQVMAKREWQDKGFPNVAGIRHAMSDLGLVDLPSNTIGATVSRYTPGKGLIDTKHADYPKGIAAEHMGQLATLVPHEVGAPAIAKALAQRNEENFARGAKSVLTPTRHAMMPTKGLPSAQYFDQEWLDNYMKYVNRGR